MKVLLLTSSYNLSANIGMRAFLENKNLKKHGIEVRGILSAATFDFTPQGMNRMNKFISTSGSVFFLKTVITNAFKNFWIRFGGFFVSKKNRTYFTLEELAEAHQIPYQEVSSINSEEAKNFITEKNPDLLVSCFLLEKVSTEVLALAPQGAINVHPALTQKHRGSFTAFWALLKNWKHSGATVHFMTENLDEGNVILQKHFFVHPSDTIYSVNEKSAVLGGNLLVKALIKIKRKKARAYALQKLGGLFSMPPLKEVRKFYARGKHSMTFKDLFKL
jgi:folate-dependent phosphoribosylglycinamide formyltransferase PurN